MGELAYHQYRAACKIADKAKLLKKTAAVLLLVNSNDVTQQELDEAKKIFAKVNGGREKIEKNEDGVSSNSSADIKLEKIIQNTLVNTAAELFTKVERSLVCYQTSYKEILRAKRHAVAYKAKGAAVSGVGVGVGTLTLVAAGTNIYNAVFVTGIASLGGPFGIVAGVACLGVGCYYGLDLFKKGQEMFKEPTVRENLNEIMKKALSAYDDEKYQEFIHALSEEYDGSGKIKIKGVTHAALKSDAKKTFQLALNDELVKEVKGLDKQTSELRRQGIYGFFKGACGKLKDSMLSKERTRLALEYLQDSLEMPFFSRLEEIRNIARINITILNIMERAADAYQEAIEAVEEVRKSVRENYQFVSKVKLRLETLEDFLWIISGDELSDTNTPLFITFPDETKSASVLDDKYINYLNNQQSFNQDKYYKAIYFERLAEKEAKINKLNSLCHWQSAQEIYNIARELNPDNPTYSLGYARCLLKLSKYTQVIELSDACPALNSLSEYWYLRSVAYFKQKKYVDAMICNSEALSLDPGNNSAGYVKNSHSDESPVYNILSIDGGGIRGVLPALWLSEIEYRTHRPICHLFNMIAGTSTGGIIAAGLSAPKFFDETRLSNSLTELVIPAANESYSIMPHLFTRYDARKNNKNEEVNDTYVNILMATTAAPTLFPPHKIASTACNEAIRYNVSEEKISVLSLGSGCYLPDPQNPDQYRNLLFWAQNLPKLMISAQEGNTDREMYNKLKNRYQRWQVFFEEPVGIDDHESISSLLELGYQYIEELDCSDENPINTLAESLISRV
ncbi:20794_t:CDS:2 [Dentiscutata erythropus]|uniref:20794_t:CDS:1 n=1 Tax=Dentiscutata erythropus TaxID=1348616 RepID=A0A9N9F2H9_9GLOM|nr:20794_t:CDS:2 [Dentiscutata erythropus]